MGIGVGEVVGVGAGAAVGVGRDVGVGVGAGVGVGRDVGVGVGVGAGVGVGRDVGVGVGAGVGVGRDVGVGAGVAVGTTVEVGWDVDVGNSDPMGVAVGAGVSVGVAVASRAGPGVALVSVLASDRESSSTPQPSSRSTATKQMNPVNQNCTLTFWMAADNRCIQTPSQFLSGTGHYCLNSTAHQTPLYHSRRSSQERPDLHCLRGFECHGNELPGRFSSEEKP